MNDTTFELLLGDDPDAIEQHAYDLVQQGEYDQARTVFKLAHGFRNYSDFEVPGGPAAVQRHTERLIRTVKRLFNNELEAKVARRLTRTMFILEHSLPGEPTNNLFQYMLLEHVLPPGSKGKISTRETCRTD